MPKHYIRLDSSGFIVYGFSDVFEKPEASDVLLCENEYLQFNLGDFKKIGYFEANPNLFDSDGKPKYKFIDNKIVEARDLWNPIRERIARNFRRSMGDDENLKKGMM